MSATSADAAPPTHALAVEWAPRRAAVAPTHPRVPVRTVPVTILAWLALGIVARWWMRLISDNPEFTWGGTIFILVAFAITAFGHSVARVVRSRARRRWSTLARIVGAVLTLPLFVGAGALMLPTVVGASLARWRGDWPRWARAAVALMALAGPVFALVNVIDDPGIGAGSSLGLVLFLATYALVVESMGSVAAPLPDGWRLPTWARRVAVAFGLVGLGAVASAGAGIILFGG